jgi:AcrR family transcriptional regulator
VSKTPQHPLSGRGAEATRNDRRILDSARAVFLANPDASITAVAKQAGVGISALYSRYGSKDELLRKLCRDGLALFVSETEAALARARAGEDHWTVFADLMRRLTDADTTAMTVALAGKFAPTEDMFALGDYSNKVLGELFTLVHDALRPDLDVLDVSFVLEMLTVVKGAAAERTSELRHRYLALILGGIRARDGQELPGPPPGWPELSGRWVPK